MRNVFNLIKKDFYNIFHTRSIWVTLLAFALIPMLYAVLNIQVSWNPYSPKNTSRLQIAVVNNDEGASLKSRPFNVGNQVVKQLHKNHQIHWIFTNDWSANNGLENGKYYAIIEIPDDFSSKLTTFATSDPQKPTIVYKQNEKLNPAATKIIGQAQNSLTDNIRQNFIKTASKTALQTANKAGATIATKKPEILQVRSSLTDAISTINKTEKTLNGVNQTNRKTQAALQTMKSDLPKISSQIDDLQSVVNNTKALNNATQQLNHSLQSNLGSGINSLQTQGTRLQNRFNGLPSGHVSSTTLRSTSSSATSLLNGINDTLSDTLRMLDIINNFVPNNRTSALISSVSKAKRSVDRQKSLVSQLRGAHSTSKQQSLIRSLQGASNTLNTALDTAYTNFNSTTSPALNGLNNSLNANLNGNSQVVQSMRSVIPELRAMANAGSITASQTSDINSRLDKVKGTLQSLDKQMSFLSSRNLDKLIKLLGTDPSLSSILSSPIKLQTKKIYPMKNFGWQVTPFYTVLALWVGMLLMSTILAWEYILPDNKNGLERPNELQSYLGKLPLYLGMGFAQASFAWLGEIVLGVRPVHWFLFLLAFYAASFTFAVIMFNLVFMLGNAGKVIIVLMMLIQLFGTGGMYPLEVVPKDLAALAPFMPFTYAMQLFREVMTIPNWSVIGHDLLCLFLFVVFFTLIMPLRRVFEKLVFQMESDMAKSKL
ncbi:yhgE/Pip domain-containing protein [Secundilactobacillus pentosiphilus]|uniref:YhgE/Pip domain-containing protein n=1 Tax=Secundilactobacillus pentosiphilus TaxID=1714682 RepID=A0A1Z5IY46_9LACO|nr:YhgE/Pip domain-containing protein [Secundilactobacillus pentosiphilus]GAX06589.1 yhgE/Pip domain-containing protein [Secundilactobacillus pentosiphilus]